MTKALLALLIFWMVIIASLVYASEELVWTPVKIPGLGIFVKGIENGGLWFHGDFGWLNTDRQLLITRDAGRSWTLSLIPSETRQFYDSYFINSLEGWVVEWPLSLYHTKNGGKSWEKIDVLLANESGESISAGIARVYFKDSMHGLGAFAVAGGFYPAWSRGIIARTEDGGQHWTELAIDVLFPQLIGFNDHIWIVSQVGFAYYTPDFGNTFRKISIPSLDPAHLVFASPLSGWTTDGYRILKTMDGGNTWSDPIFTQVARRLGSGIRNLCLMSKNLGAISWYSISEEEDGPSLLYVTYDGGKSWTEYSVPVRSDYMLGCNNQLGELWLLPHLFSEEMTIFYASFDTVTAIQPSNKLFITWALLKTRKEH